MASHMSKHRLDEMFRQVLRVLGVKLRHRRRYADCPKPPWHWEANEDGIWMTVGAPGWFGQGEWLMGLCREWEAATSICGLTVYPLGCDGIIVRCHFADGAGAWTEHEATADNLGTALVEALYDAFRTVGILNGQVYA